MRTVLLVRRLGMLMLLAPLGCGGSIKLDVPPIDPVGDAGFVRAMGGLLGSPIVGGNKVTTLKNGDEVFPQLIQAVRSAERSITLETYVFDSGKVADAVTEALAERARVGVRVHVIIDPVGSLTGNPDNDRKLRQAGVELVHYHAVPWWRPSFLVKLNYRTHRKLLIVDGRLGFIGGFGIADSWRGDGARPAEWRDNHYRVEGPVVRQLQAAFLDHWLRLTGRVLYGEDYLPEIEPIGEASAQVVSSNAGGQGYEVRLGYLMALSAARESVRLATAYFVPDGEVVRQLVAASKRGVRVRVLVAGKHTDSPISRRASRAAWGPLLDAGVEIYEYRPTMYHAKVLVVDDAWVTLGSANVDHRSFYLNAEANMNVLSDAFAGEQAELFDEDMARCRRIDRAMWGGRSIVTKFLDSLASLCSPNL